MTKWFLQQNALNRLLLKFLFNVVFYYLIQIFVNLFWEDDNTILSTIIIISSFLYGIIFTLLFDWQLVKAVFSNNRDGKIN